VRVVTHTAPSPVATPKAPRTSNSWLVSRLLPAGVVAPTVLGGMLDGKVADVLEPEAEVPDPLAPDWVVLWQPVIDRDAATKADRPNTDRRFEDDMAPTPGQNRDSGYPMRPNFGIAHDPHCLRPWSGAGGCTRDERRI
jgi:hypothetical protein